MIYGSKLILLPENPADRAFQPAESGEVRIFCRRTNGTYLNYRAAAGSGDAAHCDDCERLLANDVTEIRIRHPEGSEMSVHIQNGLYSVGMIDEEAGVIYYYDNKEGEDGAAELHGETFPLHMISKNKALVCAMIEDFIQTGRPSEAVDWVEEEF